MQTSWPWGAGSDL